VGVRTQTSAARAIIELLVRNMCGVRRMVRVLSGLWPGGAVLSKAARPKSAAPVSLAGSYPPAAGLSPARL
jgi:hypothetical protein